MKACLSFEMQDYLCFTFLVCAFHIQLLLFSLVLAGFNITLFNFMLRGAEYRGAMFWLMLASVEGINLPSCFLLAVLLATSYAYGFLSPRLSKHVDCTFWNGIIECFSLEGSLKTSQFQTPATSRDNSHWVRLPGLHPAEP